MSKPFNHDARLTSMLSWMRPHDSETEAGWTETFILPYKPLLFGDKDETMAYVIQVGEPNGVLFSCHVDTVHRKDGAQQIVYDEANHQYCKIDDQPLGADDTAGCWLLLEMIDAGVNGTYIFHRGEERGGVGSGWMADAESEWLKQFKHAVAFDRKATHSVITHQSRGRCCSDEFAQALADALNALNDEFMFIPDDTGIYTDTAEYTHLIPECTNISCGYYDEHTPNERLDIAHLYALRDACIKLDWTSLPAERTPTKPPRSLYSYFPTVSDYDDLYQMSRDDMLDLAMYDPETFVDMVREELLGPVASFAADDWYDYDGGKKQ